MFLSIFPLQAQQRIDPDHNHNQDIYQQIERDFEEGRLNLDQKVLFKFYATTSPKKLPPDYQKEHTSPIKCGTPAILDFQQNRSKLSRATISEIESAMTPQTNAVETHISPSGRFEIEYETSGEHAVPSEDSDQDGIPNYVEKAAAAADSSYRHMVQNLGYSNPVPGDETYSIEIRNLAPVYGDIRPSGNTTIIRVENDYSEDFPPNDHPDGEQTGALFATIAHELKHAIQYANSRWYGFGENSSSPHSPNWSEMDATLMEEVVYDNVNDYYNYLESSSSIFNSPWNSIPDAYWHVSWMLYFEEKFGSQFWVEVWTRIKERYESEKGSANPQYLGMYETIVSTLDQNYNRSINLEFAESHLWHLASGSYFDQASNGFSAHDYGFEERTHYPTPNLSATVNGVRDSLNNSRIVDPLAANYFQIVPSGNEQHQIKITLYADTTVYSAGAIAYFRDGTTDAFFRSNHEIVLETPWDWAEVEKVGVVATNFNQEVNPLEINIGASSYRAEFLALEQNYPNPFHPTTTIKFRLLEDSNVQLRIYDITGRLVQTLLDENLSSGTHEQTFDANGLASGIYFYQLVTDEHTAAKKMTLIK